MLGQNLGVDTTEGMAHLQTAAREMVAAARSFLDAVEEVVNDDARMATVMSGMTNVLKDATDAVSDLGRRAGFGRSSGSGPGDDGAAASPPKVERIDLE